MEFWNVGQLAIIWTFACMLVTSAALVLLFNFQHKYSETFFNLIIVGCICSCFCFLHFLHVYWTASDTNILDIKKLKDEYLFSVVVFAITVGIIFASVTLDRNSYRLCFGVYLFLALILIIAREKTLQQLYSVICDEDFNTTQAAIYTQKQLQPTQHVISTEKQLHPKQIGLAMTCSNRFGPVTTTLILEYALIYIPVSIMFFYRTQDKEWMNISSEKCPGCQYNISLCHQCTVFYTVVIWIVRPLYHIIVQHCNSAVQRFDVIPIVSTLTIYVILQIYIIAQYVCKEKRSNDVCINSVDEIDLALQEKDLVI